MMTTGTNNLPIAILDFGSQFTHLISRRLRAANIYCEILSSEVSIEELRGRQVRGVILSGGPSSVYASNAPGFNADVLELGVPILGICYGFHLLSKHLAGTVLLGDSWEFGRSQISLVGASPIFSGLPSELCAWMSHGDTVQDLPSGFHVTGKTDNQMIAAAEDPLRNFYGLQFHPEVFHTDYGQEMLRNFATQVCGIQTQWTMDAYIETLERRITAEVGDRKVFLFASGGIDSTVVFLLLNRVLGKSRVLGIFIDTGLLRPGDRTMVPELFTAHGIDNFVVVDASEEFLGALEGISEPEKKRNIIGQLFLDTKERIMEEQELRQEEWILAQGTIYPDIITSGGSQHAHVIKTHHNALPSLRHKIEVLEPLRYLYKDEVRALAKELGMSDEVIWRHPFPGPGIAVRIAGVVTDPEKLDLYHKLDRIVLRHLWASGWYPKLWMGFPVLLDMRELAEAEFQFPNELLERATRIAVSRLQKGGADYTQFEASVLPTRSVGVQGDYRTYEHPVELRITGNTGRYHVPHQIMQEVSTDITNRVPGLNRVLLNIAWKGQPEDWRRVVVLRMLMSVDTLTADWARLEHPLLNDLATEIMGVSPDVDAVLLDITQKPPATMEWE